MLKRIVAIVVIFLLVDGIIAFFVVRDRGQKRFDAEIRAAAERYGLDPSLVKAVVRRESAFNARAKGSAGEIGLMQIQEIAAQEWADAEMIDNYDHSSCFHPGTNTMAGTFYLAKVLKRYKHTDNPMVYGLADYNAGRTHVVRWKKGAAETNSAQFLAQMDYPGTRRYIEEVLRWKRKYDRRFNQ